MAQLLPQLRDALQKRQTEFRGQLETITGKTVRRQLEADLGLAKKSLDAIKEQIDVLINEILLEPEQGAQAEEVKSKAGSRTKASAGRAKGKKGGDDDGEEEEEEEGPGSEEEEEGAARKRGSKGAKPAPAPAKKYSGKVEKLRNICRLASVKIPPGVYKAKSDAGVEEGLQALLSKHGLNASSSEAKISQVKKKLEKERELDGMDMGNIISTSSRPRRATAAVNYKAVLEQLKSPGSDEEEDGEQEEEKGGRPAKAKAGSKKGKKPVKKEGQEDSSEGSGSEGGGEEEEEEEGGASDSGSASDSESDFEGSEEEDEEEDLKPKGKRSAGKGPAAKRARKAADTDEDDD